MSPPPPKPVSSGHKKSERDQALKRKNQVQEKIGLNIQITTQVKTTPPHGDLRFDTSKMTIAVTGSADAVPNRRCLRILWVAMSVGCTRNTRSPGRKNGRVNCCKRRRSAFLALVSIIEGRNPARTAKTAKTAATAFPVENQSLGPTPVLGWGKQTRAGSS